MLSVQCGDAELCVRSCSPHCNTTLQHNSATPHCNTTLHRLLTGASARDPAHRTPHQTAPPHCNTTLQQHTATPVCAGAPARDPARLTATPHYNTTLQHHTATTHYNNTLQHLLALERLREILLAALHDHVHVFFAYFIILHVNNRVFPCETHRKSVNVRVYVTVSVSGFVRACIVSVSEFVCARIVRLLRNPSCE